MRSSDEAKLTKRFGGGKKNPDHTLGASSIPQMEGVNLALMESKQAEGKVGTGR